MLKRSVLAALVGAIWFPTLGQASYVPAAESLPGNFGRSTKSVSAEQKEQEDKDSKKKSNLIQVHVSGIT